MAIIKSAMVVGSLTLCSRILGYIRDILIAATLGASGIADAFFVAFRLPNMFRQLSAEGAMHNAFVPLFSGMLEQEGKEKAIRFGSQVFIWMFFILTLLSSIIVWQMSWVMTFLAPGYLDNAEKFAQVVLLGQIAFPYIVFVSLATVFGGMLNSFGKFAISAAVPMLLNIVLIITLLFFVDASPAQSLSTGVLIGGAFQLCVVAGAAYFYGIRLSFSQPELSRPIKQLFTRMVPGILGGGVTQIAIWINTIIATLVPGAVSYLYYADRLVQFPLALIGTAMGTALLPGLSRHIRASEHDMANEMQNKAIEFVLMLCFPAAVALFVLAEPLIALMFERGAFTLLATQQTAKALAVFAFGLPAFALVKVLAPAFFAAGDTRTPVIIAFFCLAVGATIGFTTIYTLGHVGLALATTFSTWCNALLLGGILIRKGRLSILCEQWWRFVKFCIAALVMGGAIHYLFVQLQTTSPQDLLGRIWVVVLVVLAGIVSYFLCVLLLRASSKQRLKSLFS